jgi:hypothetical protein
MTLFDAVQFGCGFTLGVFAAVTLGLVLAVTLGGVLAKLARKALNALGP